MTTLGGRAALAAYNGQRQQEQQQQTRPSNSDTQAQGQQQIPTAIMHPQQHPLTAVYNLKAQRQRAVSTQQQMMAASMQSRQQHPAFVLQQQQPRVYQQLTPEQLAYLQIPARYQHQYPRQPLEPWQHALLQLHRQHQLQQQRQQQAPLAKPQPQRLQRWQLDLLICSFSNNGPVDLNSRSATETPNFVFPLSTQSTATISLLSTSDAAAVCIHIKDWLIKSFGNPAFFAPNIVRMEGLELGRLGPQTPGSVLFAKDACYLNGDRDRPVTVLGVLVEHDPNVRWFYTYLPVNSLLNRLNNNGLLELGKIFETGTEVHRKFATYIQHSFLSAVTAPHSRDFVNAETMTDCCPTIRDPDTALQRLEKNGFLHFASMKDGSGGAGLDLSDDRYLEYLDAAEREIASRVHLRCAEYMLVKRNFFRSFFEEIYRTDKKIEGLNPSATTTAANRTAAAPINNASTPQDTPSQTRASTPQSTPQTPARRGGRRVRVRTERAHQMWLESEYEWRTTRAKVLVTAWKELGFLDEGRFLGWVEAGGMLEGEFGQEDDSDDDEERDCVAMANV